MNKCYMCDRKLDGDIRRLYNKNLCKECYQEEMRCIEEEAYPIM